MFVCLVFRLVCLLWAVISRGVSGRTYTSLLEPRYDGANYQRNALFSGLLNANNLWFRKANPMASSYTRARQEWTSGKRRQDLYNGSDYDWNSFPWMEETSSWPQDYSSWPQQAPTQASLQQGPQAIQSSQIQAPAVEAPYPVPSQVPTRFVGQFNTPRAWPHGRYTGSAFPTAKSQTWRYPVKSGQNARPYPARPADILLEVHNATRVCSPGPPLGVNPLVRNCLIIGDSISLGYLATVKSELRGLCQVQHAPFAKGSGAVDSRYGLRCMSMMLRTTALEPTSYDAIVFNFGMHDIDYSKRFPEEFVPIEEYKNNLLKIKELLVQTGAQLAFALTTPVPIAGRRNRRVVEYNKEARRVMERRGQVEIVDLHATVIHECGEPPYETCSIMRHPKDVHFNFKGNTLLGLKVAATLRNLLSKAKPRGNNSPPKAPELSAREGLASSYMHDDNSFCPDMVTRCPAGTTCCENLLSLTGYGCCMEKDAFGCPDSWHCCPRGSHCSPDCNFRSCKCMFPSTRPTVSSKARNKESKKERKQGKGKLKSEHGSNSQDVTLDKPVKPAKPSVPVEPVKQGIDKTLVSKTSEKLKTEEGNDRKDSHKKAATKQKQKAIKTMLGPKKRHDQGLKSKHHFPKKHKKGRSKQRQNSAKKLRSKTKEKTSGKTMRKFEVKAHRNHRKSNYHHTLKQLWVTRLGKQHGITRKRKPHFAFSHMRGKRKHHDLSYPHVKKRKKDYETHNSHTSLTEELKHLIIKQRRKKLGSRLRAHTHGSVKFGIKNNLEKTKKTEKSNLLAKAGQFARFHSSRNRKISFSKTTDVSKHKGSPLSLTGGKLVTKIKVNNPREKVQDKEKVKEKNVHGNQEGKMRKNEDSPIKKHTESWPKDLNAPERLANNWSRTSNETRLKNKSPNQSGNQALNPDIRQKTTDGNAIRARLKNVHSTRVYAEIPTDKFERPSNDSTLKNHTTQSIEAKQATTLNQVSADINEKGKDQITTSKKLSQEASDGFEAHEHDILSAINKTKGQSADTEISSFHLNPNHPVHFASSKTDVKENRNTSRPSGKGRETMVKSGVRILHMYVANTNDTISRTSGFNSKIDEVVGDSGLTDSQTASGFNDLFPRTDGSFKGEDATEQMENVNGKMDGDVSGSGFQADKPFQSLASGFLQFLESTPFYETNGDLLTDEKVEKDMKESLRAEEESNVADVPWNESSLESGNDVIELKAQQTDDHQNLNDDNGGESGLVSNGELSFTSGSGFESGSSPSYGYLDTNGYYNGRAVAKHKSEHFKGDIGRSGRGRDAGDRPINNDSSSDHLIRKLLLENEETENVAYVSSIHDSNSSKRREGSVLGGNGFYMSTSWPDVIIASSADTSNRGSGIDDDSSGDFRGSLHFGGESDIDDESEVEFFL